MRPDELTADLVLSAYSQGVFPMAHPEEDDAIYWYAPDPRAILPLDDFRMPKNLRKLILRGEFVATANHAFERVIQACADRDQTWISPEIISVYCELHSAGYAHSVEVWFDEELVGGLYGVALGGAFFGESMFHRKSDASKIALAALVSQLRRRRFTLLDTQFSTPHLARFGVIEIPRACYERKLADALAEDVSW